jgi:uncharacterized protein (TIGR03118 family)
MFTRIRKSAGLFAVCLLASGPALAEGYQLTNLVANKQIYMPEIIDPYMVNAWGIAIRPAGAGGHFWINNTDTGTVSLYVGDVGKTKLFQDEVKLITLPAPQKGEKSAPTGQVFNGQPNEFIVTHDGITGPSKFLFCTEEGTILGWTEKKNQDGSFTRPANGVIAVDQSKVGAIYKGMGISVGRAGGNLIYAADFGRSKIDVYDASFKPVMLENGFNRPKTIPADYAPFNIQELGGKLYVTYARLTKEPGEEEQGKGLGHIAEFDFEGRLLRVLEGGKDLDAPWGLAIAPADFGPASGQLLVGNFGDGRIVTYDLASGKQTGTLKRPDGAALEIDGLWGLIFGNGESLGEKNTLYFAAGPAEEIDGVFGKITAVK